MPVRRRLSRSQSTSESRAGPVYRQRWEFYAVTVCLFLVFAYPGFIYRYLWRRPAP